MKKIVIGAIVIFFLISTIMNLINLNNDELLSDSNTTEFSATVTRIEILESSYEKTFVIHTKEYGDKIRIHLKTEFTESDDINNIGIGETIHFRVKNIWVENLDSLSFFEIVSLKSEKKEIISVDEQNEKILSQRQQATITSVIMLVGVCAISGFYMFRSTKQKNKDF